MAYNKISLPMKLHPALDQSVRSFKLATKDGKGSIVLTKHVNFKPQEMTKQERSQVCCMDKVSNLRFIYRSIQPALEMQQMFFPLYLN